jgi:hypothetical protein
VEWAEIFVQLDYGIEETQNIRPLKRMKIIHTVEEV